MMTKDSNLNQEKKTKGEELRTLGLIIVVLFPMLSFFGIGAYGLVIWLIQAFGGVVPH